MGRLGSTVSVARTIAREASNDGFPNDGSVSRTDRAEEHHLRYHLTDERDHTLPGKRAPLTPSSPMPIAPGCGGGARLGRACASPETASCGPWPPPKARLPSTPG
jgi:hypothetical protein